MSERDLEIARQELRKLGPRFEEARGNNPQLFNVMVQYPDDQHPMLDELPPLPGEIEGESYLAKEIEYGPHGSPVWRFYYYGNCLNFHKFIPLAREAADCLDGLMKAVSPPTPHQKGRLELGLEWGVDEIPVLLETLLEDRAAALWVLVLHSLGWKRPPGPRIAARREIWDPGWNIGGRFTLPYDRGARERFLNRPGAIPPELHDRLGKQPTPGFFFSALRDDLFRASIKAIDLISLWAGDTLGGGEERRPPDRSGAANSDPVRRSAVPQEGGSDARPSGSSKKRYSVAEAEPLVAADLSNHPNTVISKLVKATGVSQGTIFKTQAWRRHMQEKTERKGVPEAKERPLTRKMIAVTVRPDESEGLIDDFLVRVSQILRGSAG